MAKYYEKKHPNMVDNPQEIKAIQEALRFKLGLTPTQISQLSDVSVDIIRNLANGTRKRITTETRDKLWTFLFKPPNEETQKKLCLAYGLEISKTTKGK